MNVRSFLYTAIACSMLVVSSAALAHEDEAVRVQDDARNHLVAESMPAIYGVEVTGTIFNTKTGKKRKKNAYVGGGTAFGVTADGLVLTKMHVLNPYFGDKKAKFVGQSTFEYANGNSLSISVVLMSKDGTKQQAVVVGGDPNSSVDLALLQMVSPGNTYPFLIISDALPGYDRVVSISCPYGEYLFSVGEGVVSNPSATMKERGDIRYVQTTALTLPGASGGPLLRLRDHRVVGMLDTMYSPTSDGLLGVGLGFATPGAALKAFLEKEIARLTGR